MSRELLDPFSYCDYCLRRIPRDLLEWDHVQPRTKGGDSDLDNLRAVCGTCNRSKGNKTMQEWVTRPVVCKTCGSARTTSAQSMNDRCLDCPWWEGARDAHVKGKDRWRRTDTERRERRERRQVGRAMVSMMRGLKRLGRDGYWARRERLGPPKGGRTAGRDEEWRDVIRQRIWQRENGIDPDRDGQSDPT